jgi:serine/threonine protein phosphatase 1
MKERWAIPDIHGEYNKLVSLLEKIKYTPETHQLIFLGDYIDRGPDSRGVLSKLMELQAQGAIVIRGNHDRFMIDATERGGYQDTMLWMMNGGGATLRSYEGKEALMAAHGQWLKTLPLWYEDEDYFYSHAPLPDFVGSWENWEDAKRDESILTWSYFLPEFNAFAIPNKKGVCGHVHALHQDIWQPRIYGHYLFLDAGCGCHTKANLYAYNLDRDEYCHHLQGGSNGNL